MISSNRELYEAVESTARSLEQLGRNREADSLRAALTISSAAGEVLGALRSALRIIASEELPDNLRADVENEIAMINSVLG
jgi:hypothetical protein